jgi:outer membrane protein OmpA-like peptidoglycan-associated protein
MARYDAFDNPMAGVQTAQRSGGGWRQLFWFMVAFTGLGFAGYVYVVPYRQMAGALETKSRELNDLRSGGQELSAERDRLKASIGKHETAEKEKAAQTAKRKADLDAMAAQLKTALEGLGVALTSDGQRLTVSLPSDTAVDKNGIDVSEQGTAALKILAGAAKKGDATLRIKARFGSAPAPKQLRSLFGTVGEVSAVRAARVMSVLQGAGLAPERLVIVGEGESKGGGTKGGARAAAAKSKKGPGPAAPSADRLDIEVEPG